MEIFKFCLKTSYLTLELTIISMKIDTHLWTEFDISLYVGELAYHLGIMAGVIIDLEDER